MAVIVPPTYVSYTTRTDSTQKKLATWLKEEDYHLTKSQLPLKTLAVCSGLAEYGRNNICYVPGIGSLLQLVGAFSDIPCDDKSWRELNMLERCKSCVVCHLISSPKKWLSKSKAWKSTRTIVFFAGIYL